MVIFPRVVIAGRGQINEATEVIPDSRCGTRLKICARCRNIHSSQLERMINSHYPTRKFQSRFSQHLSVPTQESEVSQCQSDICEWLRKPRKTQSFGTELAPLIVAE